MAEPKPILKEKLLERLPPPWPDNSLLFQISSEVSESRRCIVALDDDPTGTQTMHSIWVITRWEPRDLREALARGEPSFYILTNSRSMPLAEAKAINREIATNLMAAAASEARPISVVSRSDSTLRGHFPGEIDALSEALTLARGMPFDGICIIPFFPEGGRLTIDDIHWVQENGWLVPAAQTPYAQDAVFGYRNSRLPEWVEEKTEGRIPATQVLSITLDTLRKGGPEGVAKRLCQAREGRVIIVNAMEYRDIEVFVRGLHEAESKGKSFLFRTAASFVRVAAGLSKRPLLEASELLETRPPGGGLLVFGSYVPKSTAQLRAVQSLGIAECVELSVPKLLSMSTRRETISQAAVRLNLALAAGRNALVYTSRELIKNRSQEGNLAIGKSISAALIETIHNVGQEPRYVIGKGGITSSDLATEGMKVRAARVMGQILPGVPVWRLGHGSRWPGMPYVVFPGNVGDKDSVARIVRMLDQYNPNA